MKVFVPLLMRLSQHLRISKLLQLLLLIPLLLSGITVHAQLSTDVFNVKVDDTLYLTRLPSKWSIRAYAVLKHQQFGIGSRTTNNAYGFSPTKSNAVGLGFSFYGLNIDLGIIAFNNQPQNDTENESKLFNFVSSLYLKAHLFELNLHKSIGHFGWINEDGGAVFLDKDIPIAFRPDINVTALNLNYNYLFNSGRMTFGSISGLEIQKRSAGGPISGIHLGMYNMHADSMLVPVVYESNFDSMANISDAFILTAGISAGYAYTLVLPKHFFISLALTPGISLSRSELKSHDAWYVGGTPANLSYKLLTRGAAGYSGPKIYVVFSLLHDNYLMNISNQNYFVQDMKKIKAVIGYRF